MDKLEKAIKTCNDLKNELESRMHYDTFGSKTRLAGIFFNDDFDDVISAMEEALERIGELEEQVEALEDNIEGLEDKLEELEAEVANA